MHASVDSSRRRSGCSHSFHFDPCGVPLDRPGVQGPEVLEDDSQSGSRTVSLRRSTACAHTLRIVGGNHADSYSPDRDPTMGAPWRFHPSTLRNDHEVPTRKKSEDENPRASSRSSHGITSEDEGRRALSKKAFIRMDRIFTERRHSSFASRENKAGKDPSHRRFPHFRHDSASRRYDASRVPSKGAPCVRSRFPPDDHRVLITHALHLSSLGTSFRRFHFACLALILAGSNASI